MGKKQYERPIINKQYSGFMNKFGNATVSQPKTEIEDLPVKELVAQYGSPLFVMSERVMRENQRNVARIFRTRYPKVQFAWSYKTNYMNAVCSVFHQEGSWAEVVSEFEYDRARRLGVQGEHIIFNGPDKSTEGLERAIREKAKIHIDHYDELYELIEITERLGLTAQVAIRVNYDVGVYPKWDRFGFNYENGEAREALKRIVVNKKLKLVGLHSHIGTYMMSPEPYRIAMTKMVTLVNWLKAQHNVHLEYLDAGGGLPSHNTLKGQYLQAEEALPALDQYADAITGPLFELESYGDSMPTLILESGRALIDNAGFLISTIAALKRLSDGKRAYIIDAGINLLFTSFWYKHKLVPAQATGVIKENASVFGPLCMNIDCIHEDISLPAMKKGEHVVLFNVGAYTMTQWMQFITLRPSVVMIMEKGGVEVIRKGESLDYVMQLEQTPDSLKKFSLV
jgi:diaminopimelate decarboxylase